MRGPGSDERRATAPARVLRPVRVLDREIAVDDRGEGPGVVVLVHGIGVSGRYFEPLAAELARTHRVITPDLPGFGDSPNGGPPLDIEELGEVVAALVRKEGLVTPLLLGHSMGAQVVVAAAAAHPGLAGGLVLVGPVVEPGTRSLARQALRLLRDTRHETVRANGMTIRDYVRAGPVWYARHLGPMRDYRTEEHLREVIAPVVVVRGEDDPVAPWDYVERLAACAPNGRAVEVPGAGHIAMFPDPVPVAEVCRELAR